MMESLLKFEADFKTIQVIYNSIGNKDLATVAKLMTIRKSLCPTIGWLYPDVQRSSFLVLYYYFQKGASQRK